MGASHRTYHKIPCEWCGQRVGRNMYGVHQKTCPNKPISEMTFGEITGRYADRDDVKGFMNANRLR